MDEICEECRSGTHEECEDPELTGNTRETGWSYVKRCCCGDTLGPMMW